MCSQFHDKPLSFVHAYLTEYVTKGVVLIVKDIASPQKVIAFIIAEKMLFDYLYIDIFAVREEYRGLGIGTVLINKMLEYGKLHKFNATWLVTGKDNIVANKLYQKSGLDKHEMNLYVKYYNHDEKL